MCRMIHPLFSALHPKMAEVYKNRIKKNQTLGLVGNGVPMKSGF